MTELFAALAAAKARGEQAGFTAAVAKATALVVARHPNLKQHLFHGLFAGRSVSEYDGVTSAMMVQRTDARGEDVLFAATLRDADRRTVADLHVQIDRYKRAPLDELPEYQALARLQKIPALLRTLLSYKLRSSAAFYEKTIGATYGVSAYCGAARVPITTGHALAPMACSFFVGTATDRPWVVGGVVTVRKILSLSMTVDHYLVDGVEAVQVLSEIGEKLASPAALGLSTAVRSAA